MQEEIEEFRAREVDVIAIGQGTGDEAAHYARKWGIDFPILGDPDGNAYLAYRMLRGTWWTVLFRSLLLAPFDTLSKVASADLAGAQLAAADVLRLGGVAIVERGGTLRFLHRAADTADIPPNREVLAALDRLAPAAG